MGKAYNNGVNVPTGFNHNHNQPIDSRIVVDTFNDLLVDSESIIPTVYLYKWIKITANDTGIEYKWNGADRTVAGNWEKAVSESWIKGSLGEGTADLAEPGYPNKVESYVSAAMGYDIEIGKGLPIYDSYAMLAIGQGHRITGSGYGIVAGNAIKLNNSGAYGFYLGNGIDVGSSSSENYISGHTINVGGNSPENYITGHMIDVNDDSSLNYISGVGLNIEGQSHFVRAFMAGSPPFPERIYVSGQGNFVHMTTDSPNGDRTIAGRFNFVSGFSHKITSADARTNAIIGGQNNEIVGTGSINLSLIHI